MPKRTLPAAAVATQFKAGNPGRPKGSRNKIAESFLDVMYHDWAAHGADAVVAARKADPVAYVRVVASLLPQKVELNKAAAAMTDDELLAIIRRSAPEPQPQPEVEHSQRVH